MLLVLFLLQCGTSTLHQLPQCRSCYIWGKIHSNPSMMGPKIIWLVTHSWCHSNKINLSIQNFFLLIFHCSFPIKLYHGDSLQCKYIRIKTFKQNYSNVFIYCVYWILIFQFQVVASQGDQENFNGKRLRTNQDAKSALIKRRTPIHQYIYTISTYNQKSQQ